MKYCKKCGKQIHTKSDLCKECRTLGPRLCACGCGEFVTSKDYRVRFLPGHSNRSEDIKNKKKQILLEKYGVDNISKLESIKNLKKQLCLQRYGTAYVFQSEEIKEKSKQSCLERFGVENAHKAKSVIEKTKNTCLERYGVECVTQTDFQKQKSRETCLERYGVDIASKSQTVKDKVRQTMLDRFGMWNSQTEEFKEKARKTCLERYGTDWFVQSEIQKQKSRETCLRRYGVEFSSCAPEVKEIKRLACQEKYGVNNPLQLKEIRDKVENICLQKYGYKNPFNNSDFQKRTTERQRTLSWNIMQTRKDWIPQFTKEEFLEKGWFDKITGQRNSWNFKCAKCGEISQISYLQIHCPKCKKFARSYAENEIYEWLKQLIPDTEIIANAKKVIDNTNKELDIYIPSKKLAIEFDGLYWHSLKYDERGDGLITKTILCEKQGIQLIHIFEDFWINNPDKVKSLITNKLGIYNKIIDAKECQISFLNGLNYCDFVVNNSTNEDIECAYCVGLIHNDELVAVMSFKTTKYQDEYEISNICYKNSIYVVNGSQTMFNFFLNHIYAKKITTYVDRCLYKGSEFLSLGFLLTKILPPQRYKIKGIHRMLDINNLENDTSCIIYDCGSLLYEWINPIHNRYK